MVKEAQTETPAKNVQKNGKLVFSYLPGYARFIKDNHLIGYIKEQIRLSREINLPAMKFIEGISDDELLEMGIPAHTEFLTAAEHNGLREQIEKGLKKWIDNELVVMQREDLTAEDITLAGHIRKRSLVRFIPDYTTDVSEAIELVKEIDSFIVESTTAATNVYLQLLKDRIEEQAIFTEKLANTSPGLQYIYDLEQNSLNYANRNYLKYFGLTLQQVQDMRSSIRKSVVHPDDVSLSAEGIEKCKIAADDEVISWEYRLKKEDGSYLWMRNYSSVLKRNEEGKPVEMVGIILNVDVEKQTANKLILREKQLLEAQKQAQVGSFELDVETGIMDVTPQFCEIYEMTDFVLNNLIDHVHPDDRDRINANRDKAVRDGSLYDNEYRYLINGHEKIIRSRGIVSVKNGRKVLIGTAQDVTERSNMLLELQESDKRYKQAQELSRAGTWAWNLVTNKIEWTDALYNIYGIPTGTELNFEDIINYSDPDEHELIKDRLRNTIQSLQPSETYYHITLKDGTKKILHAKSEAFADLSGKPHKVIGVIQDVTERQQLIDKLQQSEELFKQAQARTHIGNWTWDIPANKVTWSDEMYRVYGLEPQSEEVNYETYISHIHPDDRENRIKQIQHVFETGEAEDHHYRIIRPDGSITILHTKSEIVYDENGKPLRMTGTCQDITEKQLLIDQLQHSDKLYKQAQAISHIGNWTWEMETKKMDWSDEVYRIYELEPQSLETSFTLDQYSLPEDAKLVRESIKHAVETNQPFDFNYRIVLHGGKIKTLHAKGETDSTKKTLTIYGTLQDITEQKEAEKRLKDYQEFIEKITDVTPSIIAAYNIHTGKYSFVNDAIEKLLGYPTSRIMEEGAPFLASIVHPDDIPVIMEKNAQALEEANRMADTDNEPITEFKYRLRNSDGEYRWFHTYGTIFERNEEGLVESVLNVSVDVTDQEKAEQELYEKNLRLQQSNTSLEEYAYVASHDLKEPLRKIATFSDRMMTSQYGVLNDEGKIYLTKIIDSSRRMQKMIGDLLFVSTVLGNNTFENCDLKSVLEEAIIPLEFKIEEKKAFIDADNLPTTSVVHSQFRQLFQNLLSNSLKFAREGVPLKIKITHKFTGAKAVERFELSKAKRYLHLQFEDNGIGFDNEYANKIFAIFQRLHGKTEYEGTGIGLSICKKIAENHGGTIVAEGIVNQGATFTVIIPA